MLRRAIALGAEGCASLAPEQLPRLRVVSDRCVVRVMADGRININAIIDATDGALSDAWQANIHSGNPLVGPLRNGLASMADTLLFLDDRVAKSKGEEAGCWFRPLRNALLKAVAFCIEVKAMHLLQQEVDRTAAGLRLPHVLLGPSGMRRVRSSVLLKMEVLRQMMQDGSSNIAANSLQRTHGLASRLASLTNDLYSSRAQTHMARVRGVSLYFDQSTHGGHDLNAAFVVSSGGCSKGAYLRPAAPSYIHTYIHTSVSSVGSIVIIDNFVSVNGDAIS